MIEPYAVTLTHEQWRLAYRALQLAYVQEYDTEKRSALAETRAVIRGGYVAAITADRAHRFTYLDAESSGKPWLC